MQVTWREKRIRYDHLRWAKELLTGPILDQVVLEGKEPGDHPDCQEKETDPEGWKRDEPEEVRRARTTGGTFHLTSQ